MIKGVITLVALLVLFAGDSIVEYVDQRPPLTIEEKQLLAKLEGKIDERTADLLSGNLLVASNYFVLDADREDPIYEVPEDFEWAVHNTQNITNGVGLNVSDDLGSTLAEYYEETIGKKYSRKGIVELFRSTAKVLKHVD